jgi:putative N6-adenine-specific DNA methylase
VPEAQDLELFAVAPPGLEPLVAAELAGLGIAGTVESGGVSWNGPPIDLLRANLHLRCATRVLVRVARFRARSFIELERQVKRIDWRPFLAEGGAVRLRVSSRKSKLYHQRAIEERFARIISDWLGAEVTGEASGGEEAEGEMPQEGQLVVVRFHRDECLVSADSSGALLHRRGYRQALARAPLRENLAAAMLLGGGWSPSSPLVDPFCGSGTIPIEAALIARRIPPGLASPALTPREFAFTAWPDHDPVAWTALLDQVRGEVRDRAGTTIVGTDRDAGAIEAARSNATRAGVGEDVHFDVRALSAMDPPAGAPWLVTNPPYGVRVGKSRPLRDLYAALGTVARERLAGGSLLILLADPDLEPQLRLDLHEILRTRNGGIPVRLLRADLPSADQPAQR